MSTAWDVAVIGAGPAGAAAACEAARAGARVLLIDKQNFPRDKVCGCCINASALATLAELGLADLPTRYGGGVVDQLLLAAGRRQVHVPLPGGVALSRRALDQALVAAAMKHGASWRPHTSAALMSDRANVRTLRLHGESITAGTVIVADGLGGTTLNDEPGMQVRIAPRSRLGASTVLDEAPSFYGRGRIHMACGDGGYVGLVRLEDQRLDVAAAFDPAFLRRHAVPGAAAAAVLQQCDLPAVAQLESARWRGTPLLTRRRAQVAGHRLLVVGDAAGYVEPFTGEGIAWALTTGAAAGRLAARGWTDRTATMWTQEHRHLTARRRWVCRTMTLALRSPMLVRAAAAVLSLHPGLAWPVLRGIHADTIQGAT